MSARVLALAALLASGLARAEADPLAAIRGTLKTFTGTTPLTATLERAVKSERKGRPPEAGRVTLDVAATPGGIAITYPAALLEALRAERAETDPEKPNPTQRAIEGVDAVDVANVLNGAADLLTDLEDAVVLSVAPADHEGRPARLHELELRVRVSQADSKWLKSATRTMRLWTTDEGVPLATETTSEYRVGFLVFTFDARDMQSQTFTRVGDRLVATRRTTRFDGEGLGEKQHQASETTLHLQPRR